MSDFPNQNASPTPSTDRIWSVLAHLGGIVAGLIPALIIYLVKKDQPSAQFDADQAKEALNFQITVLIGYVVCWVLVFVIIGAFLIWVLMLANLVLCIVAAIKANNGEAYRYPMTLRLIK
ncbi:MAG: DUF4870 domain-containing protein [Pseudomonadota bacterium]